jgi:hypothetical protein
MLRLKRGSTAAVAAPKLSIQILGHQIITAVLLNPRLSILLLDNCWKKTAAALPFRRLTSQTLEHITEAATASTRSKAVSSKHISQGATAALPAQKLSNSTSNSKDPSLSTPLKNLNRVICLSSLVCSCTVLNTQQCKTMRLEQTQFLSVLRNRHMFNRVQLALPVQRFFGQAMLDTALSHFSIQFVLSGSQPAETELYSGRDKDTYHRGPSPCRQSYRNSPGSKPHRSNPSYLG